MKKLFILLALAGCVTPGPIVVNPTPTPAPSATPFPQHPAGSSDGVIPTTCVATKPQFTVPLRNAIDLAKKDRPDILSDASGNPGDTYVLKLKNQNVWYWTVIGELGELGYDAILDDCGGSGACGEIVVAPHGTDKGKGSSDNYQVLYSTGQIPLETFRYRTSCTPKWWNAW